MARSMLRNFHSLGGYNAAGIDGLTYADKAAAETSGGAVDPGFATRQGMGNGVLLLNPRTSTGKTPPYSSARDENGSSSGYDFGVFTKPFTDINSGPGLNDGAIRIPNKSHADNYLKDYSYKIAKAHAGEKGWTSVGADPSYANGTVQLYLFGQDYLGDFNGSGYNIDENFTYLNGMHQSAWTTDSVGNSVNYNFVGSDWAFAEASYYGDYGRPKTGASSYGRRMNLPTAFTWFKTGLHAQLQNSATIEAIGVRLDNDNGYNNSITDNLAAGFDGGQVHRTDIKFSDYGTGQRSIGDLTS